MKKKMILILLAIVVVIISTLATLAFLSQQPITKAQAVSHLQDYFKKNGQPRERFSGVQVLIDSSTVGTDGLSQAFAHGNIQHADSKGETALTADTPFHAASVGKLFASASLLMAVDEGKVSLDDPIAKYLDTAITKDLFVFEGTDYASEVTLRQLVDHTSGIADYFSGSHPKEWQVGDAFIKKTTIAAEETLPFSALITGSPNALWTPAMLLDYSRTFQQAVGKPGETFHYSDSGYILIGLVLEKIEGKPYNEILNDRLFKPLAMDNTWLTFYDQPKTTGPAMADVWFAGTEVSTFNSLSVDWAGGGVVSTLRDLLKFSKAYHSGQLFDKSHFEAVFKPSHQFQPGIYYGMGGMEIHFEEFFFLLKDLPKLHGHIGILSTHLFYDPATDTHIVMNFGSDDKMEDSFKALIEILMTLKRVQ